MLPGHPLQSALSQSYIASADLGTDQHFFTEPVSSVFAAIRIGGRSKNLLEEKTTQEMLHRSNIVSEPQHTNADSMLGVVSPELQRTFGQNQVMETLNSTRAMPR